MKRGALASYSIASICTLLQNISKYAIQKPIPEQAELLHDILYVI